MSARVRGILLDAVFGTLAVAAAATTWWSIYQDARLALTVGAAALAGAIVAVVAAVLRWRAWIVALVTVVLFLALGVPLAVPDQTVEGVVPTLDGLRELVLSSALGFKQIVTISLPVGTYQGLLVPVFELALVGAVVSVSIAARARARLGDLAILPPLAIFGIGIALGSDLAIVPRACAVALVVIEVGWLVARHRGSRTAPLGAQDAAPRRGTRRLRVQSVVSGVIILVTAVAVSAAASLIAPPAGARQVVRTAIEQPFEPRDYTSPLSAYRSYLDDGASDTVEMELDGMPVGARVRIATLDTYDGVVYSVGSGEVDSASGYFARLPYRLDQSGIAGQQARIAVRIGAYDGVWVPTVGQLESIDFTGTQSASLDDAFYVNQTTGTAADTAGLSTDDAYTLQAVVPTVATDAQVAAMSPGAAEVPALGTVPAEVETRLAAYTAGASTPGEKLEAMLAGLRQEGYVSDGLPGQRASRSGHGADRITQLFTDKQMIGDSEQYAVAAAIMARALGFPARVVMGFAPDVTEGRTTVVHGSDVRAWIEVDSSSGGWMTIDPTPAVREIPPVKPDDPTSVSRPPSIVDPPLDQAPDTQTQSPPESTQDPVPAVSPLLAVLLVVAQVGGVALLVLLLIAAPFLVVLVRKARRRRRRRSRGSPRERVRAGWREFEDAVVDHGRAVAATTTRREFAAHVAAPGALLLASVADRAAFAPDEPDDEDARRVWAGVDELRTSLDRDTNRRGRWAARVSTRSLRMRSDRRRRERHRRGSGGRA